MKEAGIANKPSSPTLGLVDLIYATPWVLGAFLLRDIPGTMTLVLVPLFAASWWQDWRSARLAATYFSGQLVGFDLLTAGNYIGLVTAWTEDAPEDGILSTYTLFHWTAVFVIYIVWNLMVIRQADASTRRAFWAFTVAEIPVAAVGSVLFTAQVTAWDPPAWLQPTGVGALAVSHIAFLVLWQVMTRREGRNDQH